MAHRGQERAFRLVGGFSGSPGLLYGFHCLLAFGNIQIQSKKADLSTFHHHRSPQEFHIDQALILEPPPGSSMNDLSLLGEGTVGAGFRTIFWTANQFIQVAADDLSLSVPKQLLKSRVAGHNRVVNVSTGHSDRANVHQGLKVLPLAVGFQV